MSGLALTDASSIGRQAARGNVLDFDVDDVTPRSLLSIARLNIAKSRILPSNCSLVRIDHTCLVCSGGLAPISLTLFHGTLATVGVASSVV